MSRAAQRHVELDDKDIQETDDVEFAFALALRPGETFTVQAVTCEARYGADAAAAAMLSGAALMQGTSVFQRLTGGVAGVTYLVRCRISTSLGRMLVLPLMIRVVRLA
jgi:hypothetical protein